MPGGVPDQSRRLPALTHSIAQRIEACEAAPCHLGSRIQPHGRFLGLDPVSLRVRRVSGNAARLLAREPAALFGHAPTAWLHPDDADQPAAEAAAARTGAWRSARRSLTLRFATPNGPAADAMLYAASGLLCVELPCADAPQPAPDGGLHDLLFDAVQRISQATVTSATLADLACHALRELTGFDRVYFCAFDAKGHGHVRGRSLGGALPDLLDHRFPATDIPHQVRRLFRDNPFRLIADVEATDVAIIAPDGEDAGPHASIGFADVLATSGDTMPAERRRQLRLIDDLLDLSMLESGRMQLNFAVADAILLIDGAVAEYAATARDKAIEIVVEDRRQQRDAWIDAGRIRQVIVNLLSNALMFSPPGGRIGVELATSRPAAPANPALLIAVSDQGVGVADDELDEIFGTFVQGSRTKHGGGGTGLGLAICRRIVQAHHGHTWAMNNPDGGARFCVELPQPGIGPRGASA